MSGASTVQKHDVTSEVIIRLVILEDLDDLYKFTDQVRWEVSKETLKVLLEIVEVGHYLVADLHGKIIAKKIVARTMENAGERNVVIYSVSNRIQANIKFGLKIDGRHVHFCEGCFDVGTLIPVTKTNHSMINVIPANEVDFEALPTYDTSINAFQRKKFLKAWLAKPSAMSFAALTDGGEVVGYGQVQDAPRTKDISPLYADNPVAFVLLLKAILESIPTESRVFMLINVDYEAGMEVIKRNRGTVKVFPEEPGTFMYTKRNLEVPKFGSVFALACIGSFPA